jgi:hypothetical protein
MSKLKIEHGASRVHWTLLKTNIEEPIAHDIDLMCQWSENDRKYVINELLRFAIGAAQDFQEYKASLSASPLGGISKPSAPLTAETKLVSGLAAKEDSSAKTTVPKT